MFRYILLLFVTLLTSCASMPPKYSHEASEISVPTSAVLTTESAGKASEAAKFGVLRVICRSTSFGGTGFIHKSGNVLTAAHVVVGCPIPDLILFTSTGQQIGVSNVIADNDKDIALLRPATRLPGVPLIISTKSAPALGAQVSTWGYPGGYDGLLPLLSVGYFSGTQIFAGPTGKTVQRWVINAAFNGGNSGGPVLSVEDGLVIGIVSSKLAPLPKSINQILTALGSSRSILQYEATNADGTKTSLSEGQIVAEVLNYLRSQVQLVIGYSVSELDIKDFLNANGITP